MITTFSKTGALISGAVILASCMLNIGESLAYYGAPAQDCIAKIPKPWIRRGEDSPSSSAERLAFNRAVALCKATRGEKGSVNARTSTRSAR